MRIASPGRRRVLISTSMVVIAVYASAGRAQHASDNPVTAADDAYGLTLGLDSVGIYSPGLVRGFNPQAAGNMRIDGLYFDEQGGLSKRVIEGSAIRVGVSEIGYAFPAPTGIVDYNLRRADGDAPSATIIANVGPYDAWGISGDASLPLAGKQLVLPIGVSTGVSTVTGSFGANPGYTSRVTSVGAAPLWTPSDSVSLRGIIDWQQTRAAKTYPVFFTAGNFLPPDISTVYRGQNWAKGRSTILNLGAILSARLTNSWSLKAGAFRSVNDNPVGFADLYTNVEPNGEAEHIVVAYPDQKSSSNSGEVRLTGAFTTGGWRHQLIFMARGRDTKSLYGGEDSVDLGPALLGAFVQTPRPDFVFSARTLDHAKLWSVGAAYHVALRRSAELEVGIQQENYREKVDAPGVPESSVSARPVRVYGNAAAQIAREWTLYAGYTQGLEGSGIAPRFARNSGAVLPPSLTWQADAGVRWALTPKLKLIAGVFELQKPYFNLDSNNVDRQLGAQQARGVEVSLAGEVIHDLHVNVGILDGSVRIKGTNLAAQGIGHIAVGQPRIMYVANADYTLPWWKSASIDVSATHFGAVPESVDNAIYTPAATRTNFGLRYKFVAFGRSSSVRLQVQNVFKTKIWSNQYTPGFFQWPAPRTIFAYLTTDL